MSILSKGLGLGAAGGIFATIASYFFDFGEGNPLSKFAEKLGPDSLKNFFEKLGLSENPFAKLGANAALPIAGIIGSLFSRNIPGLKTISDFIMLPSLLFAGYTFLQGAVKGDFNDVAIKGYNLINDNTLAENFKKTDLIFSKETMDSLKGSAGNDTLTDATPARANKIMTDALDDAANTKNIREKQVSALMAINGSTKIPAADEVDATSISPRILATANQVVMEYRLTEGLRDQRPGEGTAQSNKFLTNEVAPAIDGLDINLNKLEHEADS